MSSQVFSIQPEYPILGQRFTAADAVHLDLSVDSPMLRGVDLADQDQLAESIHTAIRQGGGRIGYGGYLEERGIYRASPHFQDGQADRSLHLGVDLWADAGHPIHAPVDGVVHSLAMNEQPLDYGATIILSHTRGDLTWYTLYGHLAAADLHWQPGDRIPAGTPFCHIGQPHENGGWVPHLHIQLILDIGEAVGDFPGVALPSERDHWSRLCPDPMALIQFTS